MGVFPATRTSVFKHLEFRDSLTEMDSRFLPAFAGMTGNDGPKTVVGACGLSSLAVNLSHTLFRTENPVFCAVSVRMGRHFMQLTGLRSDVLRARGGWRFTLRLGVAGAGSRSANDSFVALSHSADEAVSCSIGALMNPFDFSEPTLMPRTSSALPVLLLTTALGASAQTRPADVESVPDGAPPPPPRVKSGEALEPEVRVIRQERQTMTEYRVSGHLRAVKVEPEGFPAYWLIDADGDGQLGPGRAGRLGGRAGDPDPAGEMMPRWVIFNW